MPMHGLHENICLSSKGRRAMRAFLQSYEMHDPKDLHQALLLISQGMQPFAGGTDLMVLFEAGRLPRTSYVNLWNLKDLKGIQIHEDKVTIGALTTYSEIREND